MTARPPRSLTLAGQGRPDVPVTLGATAQRPRDVPSRSARRATAAVDAGRTRRPRRATCTQPPAPIAGQLVASQGPPPPGAGDAAAISAPRRTTPAGKGDGTIPPRSGQPGSPRPGWAPLAARGRDPTRTNQEKSPLQRSAPRRSADLAATSRGNRDVTSQHPARVVAQRPAAMGSRAGPGSRHASARQGGRALRPAAKGRRADRGSPSQQPTRLVAPTSQRPEPARWAGECPRTGLPRRARRAARSTSTRHREDRQPPRPRLGQTCRPPAWPRRRSSAESSCSSSPLASRTHRAWHQPAGDCTS